MEEPTFHFVYTTTNHGPYKLEDKYLDFDARRDLPGVGDDILNRKDDNKGLATYKYCDKAIFDFVDAMKAKFPDSLFIVTGDHSNLFGEFNNTSFLHRDYTMREIRNTRILYATSRAFTNITTCIYRHASKHHANHHRGHRAKRVRILCSGAIRIR